MRLADLTLYGWVTFMSFVGHLASFLTTPAGVNGARFPWKRILFSLPLCAMLGITAAAVAQACNLSGTARDAIASIGGYGGTAVANALFQTLIEKMEKRK